MANTFNYTAQTKPNKVWQHRYLANAVKYGKTRNLVWLERFMFRRSYTAFCDLNNDDDNRRLFLQNLAQQMQSLQEIYGNNWELHLDYDLDEEYDEEKDDYINVITEIEFFFVIRFPKITISNSNDLTHEIQELFYSFTVKGVDCVPEDPTGTRGRVTAVENHSQYLHSHLHGRSVDKYGSGIYSFSGFCLGNNELNDLMAQLSAGFDVNIFKLYLLTVENFVQWESIEGVPYKYIKDITAGSQSTVSGGVDFSQDLVNEIMDYYQEVKADFQFLGSRFKIKLNDKFLDFVRKKFLDKDETKYFVKRTENPLEYRLFGTMQKRSQEELDSWCKDACTYFKGVKVPFVIEEYTGEVPDINAFELSPNIVNYIKRKFENELYEKQVFRSGVRRSLQGNHAKKHIA